MKLNRYKKHLEGRHKELLKKIFDKCLLCARDCFQDLFNLRVYDYLSDCTGKNDKDLIAVSDPHQQDRQGKTTEAPELGTLITLLEVGH